MTRVAAACTLLELALRDAVDRDLRGKHWLDEGIHAARVLRREVRKATA